MTNPEQSLLPPSEWVALVCPDHGTPRWMPRFDHNEQIRRCDHVPCRKPLKAVRVQEMRDGA